MYGELEQMVAENMVAAGYDPENDLDIEDYWSYILPTDKVIEDEELERKLRQVEQGDLV